MAGHTRNGPNSISNFDPKHYQDTLARGAIEADDARYDKLLQLRLPSGQVLTEADAKRLRDLTEGKTADQASPVAA